MNAKIGALLALLLLAGYFTFQYQSVKGELEAKTLMVRNLTDKIDQQNTAIDDLKTASDAKIKAGEEALAKAKAVTVTKTAKATVIYKTLPSVPGNDCRSALELGNTP